ncbi:MAG: glycoside hydrolase family 16 protein [Saprospiraceae bacterium]|nr:glycoside hydrolase family 16 protein [Saprospiraceae bacterium]MDZ4703378.1 glycoside hydrolase family 16 protein [Saprospiraceae bacterium]
MIYLIKYMSAFLALTLLHPEGSIKQVELNEVGHPNSTNFTHSTNAKYRLVWADEFKYEGLPDSTRWGYDLADGCPNVCGWGNNELQYYTQRRAQNARVENGKLIIEAHREAYQNKQYTSARLVSKHKGDWKYGKIEVRAKLPAGRGVWPAIWMLPTDWEYGGWPSSGEIDIMEYVGYEPDSVFACVHTKSYNHSIGTQRPGSLLLSDAHRKFHRYVLEWTEERMDFYVDGKRYHTFANDRTGFEAWPFDKAFHLLLNIAVGGNWGGKKGVDDGIWPQRMEVDYVRVYQR